MQIMRHTILGLIMALSIVAAGCATEPVSNINSNTAGSPSPSASSSPTGSLGTTAPVTLPVLDALFSDEAFKSTLKSKVALTDDQLAQLQKVASEEVARLRQANLEDNGAGAESSQADQSRDRAAEAVRGV